VQGVEDPADLLEIAIRRSLVFLYYSARASVSITLLARDSGHCGANLNSLTF
jgi:hypothetical protein